MFCCSCGQDQYGNLPPNGLLGLGLDAISVPSTLARKGLGPNSFSMCFGSHGLGRISFGDNGSSNQRETYHSPLSYQSKSFVTIYLANDDGKVI